MSFLMEISFPNVRHSGSKQLHSPPPNQHVIVAEKEDKIVGFACAYTNFDEQWGSLLDSLHVSQSMQRQGIGAKLLVAVAQYCKSDTASGGFVSLGGAI